jgi:hypothetical protein
MNEEILKQIIAQQVVLFKRIQKIEYEIGKGDWKSYSDQSYADELKKEAEKIIDQIRI